MSRDWVRWQIPASVRMMFGRGVGRGSCRGWHWGWHLGLGLGADRGMRADARRRQRVRVPPVGVRGAGRRVAGSRTQERRSKNAVLATAEVGNQNITGIGEGKGKTEKRAAYRDGIGLACRNAMATRTSEASQPAETARTSGWLRAKHERSSDRDGERQGQLDNAEKEPSFTGIAQSRMSGQMTPRVPTSLPSGRLSFFLKLNHRCRSILVRGLPPPFFGRRKWLVLRG